MEAHSGHKDWDLILATQEKKAEVDQPNLFYLFIFLDIFLFSGQYIGVRLYVFHRQGKREAYSMWYVLVQVSPVFVFLLFKLVQYELKMCLF